MMYIETRRAYEAGREDRRKEVNKLLIKRDALAAQRDALKAELATTKKALELACNIIQRELHWCNSSQKKACSNGEEQEECRQCWQNYCINKAKEAV
jgi:hypothetical protein